MKQQIPILTITGSDNTGLTGLQLDLKTISEMGGYALTSATCITLQNANEISEIFDVPSGLILSQVRSIVSDFQPTAIKIGLIRDGEAILQIRQELMGYRNIVCAPGILSSHGTPLVDQDIVRLILHHLVPISKLLILRCDEAERMLGRSVRSDDDMVEAAQHFVNLGAEWVMLRGGHQWEGKLTALLYGAGYKRFFTSYNTEGWQRHGVGAALSSAVATRLGFGDDVPTAILRAHDYMHSQVIYAVHDENLSLRSYDLYNELLSLIAGNYRWAHDVQFYADKLAITTRYLSHVTNMVACKSPKQLIADYLLLEARRLLENTRMNIQEISIHLGFSSQNTFCNFFKKYAHCTPTDYRNRL